MWYLSDSYPNYSSSLNKLLTTYPLILIPCIIAIYFYDGTLVLGLYPILIFRHFAFAFLLLLILLVCSKFFPSLLLINVKFFEKLGSISYGLYILHYPLLVVGEFIPMPYFIPTYIILCLILAYFAEIIFQKKILKKLTPFFNF
jgi:peptidoglycan/LPS O-acetylase OafA/YrhL